MLSNANAVVSGRTDVMLFFQIILSPFTGLVQWSWRLSEVGSSSVNPEAETGSARCSVSERELFQIEKI